MARIVEMLASLNTAILSDLSVAELVACVSGALVYDVSRLESPFRSGICSGFIEGVFIVAAPFIPLCGIDDVSNGQLRMCILPDVSHAQTASLFRIGAADPATRHVGQSCRPRTKAGVSLQQVNVFLTSLPTAVDARRGERCLPHDSATRTGRRSPMSLSRMSQGDERRPI